MSAASLNFAAGLDVLIADDTPDDVELLRRAFRIVVPTTRIHVVSTGEDALDYLRRRGRYSDTTKFPYPKMLILDLKMPRMSGTEVLRRMREEPCCAVIPTILLTDCEHQSDLGKAYEFGATSAFQKPVGFRDLQDLVRLIVEFWSMCKVPDTDIDSPIIDREGF